MRLQQAIGQDIEALTAVARVAFNGLPFTCVSSEPLAMVNSSLRWFMGAFAPSAS
jgi:hypothetical protein